MAVDPFGRAVRDHYHGERDESLIQRDGETELEHPIELFYFSEYSGEEDGAEWLESRIAGPLLDMGAGAGKHALYFQEHFETVAIEVSENLVALMDERGVEDAREADMFALREQFERDRFQSALAHGTQAGLAQSMDGLRQFLGDLAYVTQADGTAVLDFYDPDGEGASELLGYRADPTRGLAFRVMTFEYEGEVGETLLFRLFSPDRLREATIGTSWNVDEVRYASDNDYHYRSVLTKE
jgi:hypothetical protein